MNPLRFPSTLRARARFFRRTARYDVLHQLAGNAVARACVFAEIQSNCST